MFRAGTILDMHEQMERLKLAARELKGAKTRSDIARLLNESHQTVKNWETRGISDGGILKAEELIGCTCLWLRTGKGNMTPGRSSEKTEYLSVSTGLYGNKSVIISDSSALRTVLVPIIFIKMHRTDGTMQFKPESTGLSHPMLEVEMEGVSAERICAVYAPDESMEHQISKGDVVIFDGAKVEMVSGRVYAVGFADEWHVRRVFRLPGGAIRLACDNPDKSRHPDNIIEPERASDVLIIGEVIRRSGPIS